ncbi:hypothetical protein Mapa_015821 [Marchantia paleacea]|nr:hypothetical protein Mapa_015821 [Marchantia paleacea]
MWSQISIPAWPLDVHSSESQPTRNTIHTFARTRLNDMGIQGLIIQIGQDDSQPR